MPLPQTPAPDPAGALPLLTAAAVQDHLLVAGNDLERLLRLLGDAGDELLAHFHGANQALQAALATEAVSESDAGVHADANAALRARLAPLAMHLGSAITAMQFQDMATQLVTHTGQRLRHCADRLACEAFGDDDDDGAGVVDAQPLRPNPVTQDEMDAGSIELF
jgi:hypothetical protein